jgi:hypothetical protein
VSRRPGSSARLVSRRALATEHACICNGEWCPPPRNDAGARTSSGAPRRSSLPRGQYTSISGTRLGMPSASKYTGAWPCEPRPESQRPAPPFPHPPRDHHPTRRWWAHRPQPHASSSPAPRPLPPSMHAGLDWLVSPAYGTFPHRRRAVYLLMRVVDRMEASLGSLRMLVHSMFVFRQSAAQHCCRRTRAAAAIRRPSRS